MNVVDAPITRSALWLDTDRKAVAQGFRLFLRIVLDEPRLNCIALLAAAGDRRPAMQDALQAGHQAFTLRRLHLVPRAAPDDVVNGLHVFSPQPGDAHFERSFATIDAAGAWLSLHAKAPDAAELEPVLTYPAMAILIAPISNAAQEPVLVSKRMHDGSMVASWRARADIATASPL